MAQRSPNGHELSKRAFPFLARLRRDEAFRAADDAEWKAQADRIGGGARQWYAYAGWKEDHGVKLIGFATRDQADEMQRWIAASGIETRPRAARYDGHRLTVAGVEPT